MNIDFQNQKREDVKAQLIEIVEKFPVLRDELDLESKYGARLINKGSGFKYETIDNISVDISADTNRVHLFISSDYGFHMSIFKDMEAKK